MRIQCVVALPTLPRYERTEPAECGYELDPYVKLVVQRVCRAQDQRKLLGEAPVPLEFETPDWEPPSEEQFDRRPAEDEPWDLP